MTSPSPSLRPKINNVYPPGNTTLFEEYFFDAFAFQIPNLEREYLPVFWTGLYVNRQYGHGDMSDVQSYLDGLDRSKKYFTVVQYDDNILNDLKDLDILIFAQGGHGKYKDRCYPIPLNCMPSPLANPGHPKDIFANFIGAIKGRHRIREKLQTVLAGDGKYLVSETMGYDPFHEAMNRSLFSLCPRGYGQTSFRICEALQHGSVPVYVYDEPLVPFSDVCRFEDYGVLVHESEIDRIDEVLTSIDYSRYADMLDAGKKAYDRFYSYGGCYASIIERLRA